MIRKCSAVWVTAITAAIWMIRVLLCVDAKQDLRSRAADHFLLIKPSHCHR